MAGEPGFNLGDLVGTKILNNISEAVFVFDAQTHITEFANRAALEGVSQNLNSIRLISLPEIFSLECPNLHSAASIDIEDLLAAPKPSIAWAKRSDGSAYQVWVRAGRVCNGRRAFLIVSAQTKANGEPNLESEATALWQLQVAIEALPDGFVLYDADDRLVICNERYRTLYPESAAVMVPGARFEDILKFGLANGQYAAAIGREDEWLRERLEAHLAADQCLEQQLSDGRWLRILEQVVPGGGRVGLRIDVTEQIHSRERAEVAERRLLDAIDALPAGFWLFDSQDRLVLFNERYRKLFKLSADALFPGNTYENVLRYGLEKEQYPEAIGREEEWLASVLAAHRAGGYDLEYQLSDGTWIKSYNQPTSDGGQVGFRVDITKEKNQQFELQRVAFSDDLTGLRNRRELSSFLQDISRKLLEKERLAVLHIDLDKFKSINDTLGHEAGDHVLCETAKKILSGKFRFDVAARVGGDEFLLAVRTTAGDDHVVGIGSALIREIERPITYREKTCHVGASVGVAFVTKDCGVPIEEIIADADIALNAAKSAGRATCRVFTDDMRAAAVQSAQVSAQLREGIGRGEFEPHFQPQVDVESMRVVGFEALARWNHPEQGILAAGDFLSVAQESRLIEEIENQTFTKVCQAVSKLAELGLSVPRVSVNLSTAQLSDPTLVDRLIWTADAADIEPSWIGVEILESTLLDDRAAHVIENIHKLSERGFRIELDDFGTGHAAIANLRKFPVERIKIDRSLISGIDQDSELQLITGAIIGLARKLGLKVLGEGVERPEELEFMKNARCTCAQGYLIARPMRLEDLVEWIGHWPYGSASIGPGVFVA